MSIQNVLRLLQPTEHMVRANASAAAWRGFIRRISITKAGRCRQLQSRRSKISSPNRKNPIANAVDYTFAASKIQ